MQRTLSQRRFAWIHRSFLFDAAGACLLVLFLIFLYRVVQPTLGSAEYSVGSAHGVAPTPVQILAPEATDIRVSLQLEAPPLSSHWYDIRADDCISSVSIDGYDVSQILPPCTLPGIVQRINLGQFMGEGVHHLVFTIRSGGTALIGFDLQPSFLDPFLFGIRIVMLAVFLTLLYLISKAYRLSHRSVSSPTNCFKSHCPTFVWLLSHFKDPAVLAWTVCVLVLFVYAYVQPRMIAGYYSDAEQQLHLFQGTFLAPDDDEDWYRLHFAVRYRGLRPPTLRLLGDDCVEGLMINGLRIPGVQSEVCGYDVGAKVNVRQYVQSGINSFQAIVHNAGGAGALRIGVDAHDPLNSFLLFLAALTGSIALWMTLRRFSIGDDRFIAVAIFTGIFLRIYYFFATPFFVRANDVDGHIEYAHFILRHLSLPGMREMWESFQPPLYYITSAAIIGFARQFGILGYDEIRMVQFMSPILSVIGFLLCVGMLRRVLDPRKYRIEFLLSLVILAVLPGAIYNAGRVNNDVFVQFFILLGLYELIRAFEAGPQFRHWVFALIALVLGITSKTNALILAPAIFLATPFIFKGIGWKKWLLTGIVAFITVASYLSVYAIRDPQKDDVVMTNIVTNSVALNGDLVVPNTLHAFTEFSPLQVFEHPFNDAWTDTGRRAYFLEYLYKSAFFGEWGFSDQHLFVARWLVASGMILLVIAFFGMFMALRLRTPAAIVLFLYGGSVLLLHGLFRYHYPFSPSQDFRYVSSVAVVVAAFVGLGISCLPKYVRLYGIATIMLFIGSCLAFLIQLP